MATNFNRIARPYRWLEYFSCGPKLQRCRLYRVQQMATCHSALILGDGDGRFLVQLMRAHPELQAEAVDGSREMLRLLEKRVAAVGAGDRLTARCEDLRQFVPSGSYDLVATHFFLDCLETSEVAALAERIRPQLLPGAIWVVSEFAIPSGPLRLPARLLVSLLYTAFGILTGLQTRRLPSHGDGLRSAGFQLKDQKQWLGGILISELWRAEATDT